MDFGVIPVDGESVGRSSDVTGFVSFCARVVLAELPVSPTVLSLVRASVCALTVGDGVRSLAGMSALAICGAKMAAVVANSAADMRAMVWACFFPNVPFPLYSSGACMWA